MLDPADAIGTEAAAVAIYARAEDYLIQVIRRALIRVGDAPDWATAQLLAIRQERAKVTGVSAALDRRAPAIWEKAVLMSYIKGTVAADKELLALPEGVGPGISEAVFNLTEFSTPINDAAVMAIASEGIRTMHPVHQNLFRRVEDAWRRITMEAVGMSASGTMTTFDAAKDAFNRMARDGMGFYVDSAGRKWGLDTYAEMAVRTGTTRALAQGHTDTMLERGVDLVVVSSHPRPAPQCAPYERKVLSLTGKWSAGTHRIGDNIVQVKATMREAEAHGLHHPNCRHRHSAYIPGYTNTKPPVVDPDNEGYKATQKQRYLERQIRGAKRMEAAAIDDVDVKRARERQRAYQAKLRDHVAEHNLPRRRHREQLKTPGVIEVGLDPRGRPDSQH